MLYTDVFDILLGEGLLCASFVVGHLRPVPLGVHPQCSGEPTAKLTVLEAPCSKEASYPNKAQCSERVMNDRESSAVESFFQGLSGCLSD